MIKYIAVIAFCFQGECAVWTNVENFYYKESECEAAVYSQMYAMSLIGVDPEDMIPACLPTRFSRSEA
jgi:hypothetical protein